MQVEKLHMGTGSGAPSSIDDLAANDAPRGCEQKVLTAPRTKVHGSSYSAPAGHRCGNDGGGVASKL